MMLLAKDKFEAVFIATLTLQAANQHNRLRPPQPHPDWQDRQSGVVVSTFQPGGQENAPFHQAFFTGSFVLPNVPDRSKT
jgi:hypothetical protein